MSYQEVPMWRVICDRCGTSAQDSSDYWAWAGKDAADMEAESSDWLLEDGKHWCHKCVIWDDDADKLIPLPELPK